MTRTLLVGNSGSGKSTLAKQLAARDGLAHLDLDTLAWMHGVTPPTRRPLPDSAREIHAFIAANPSWVIEGCYADLLAEAARDATMLVFLNPGVETCIENARQRPFEPHKYASKEAQDANLEMLIGWIRGYETRTDVLSLQAHRALFDGFTGDKIELTSREAISAYGASGTESKPVGEIAAQLVASHREFLAFVEKRVGDRALAEEIVQDAMVKSLGRLGEIRESAVGWFYRVLRNAIIDRARRAKVQRERLEALATEIETTSEDEEMHKAVCQCVKELATTLKPEYADALQKIDVEGVAVKDYAEAAGISASNAGVRVFRARNALRQQVARSCGTCATHGCIDCTCGGPAKHDHAH